VAHVVLMRNNLYADNAFAPDRGLWKSVTARAIFHLRIDGDSVRFAPRVFTSCFPFVLDGSWAGACNIAPKMTVSPTIRGENLTVIPIRHSPKSAVGGALACVPNLVSAPPLIFPYSMKTYSASNLAGLKDIGECSPTPRK
jgi:hypothetical protein